MSMPAHASCRALVSPDVAARLLPRLQANLPDVDPAVVEAALHAAIADRPALRVVTDPPAKVPAMGDVVYRTAMWWTMFMGVSVNVDMLMADVRTPGVARARNLAYWMARECTKQSWPTLGRHFGRDHSTVMSGYKAAQQWADNDGYDLHAIKAEWIMQDTGS